MTTDTGSLDRCTRCGLCQSACPTYLESRLEQDSPRGRVWSLQQAIRDGAIDLDDTGLWGCTGCGRCVAPCPTGVDLPADLRTLWSALHERAEPPLAGITPDTPAGPGDQWLDRIRRTAVERLRHHLPAGPPGRAARDGVLLAASPYLRELRPEALGRARSWLAATGDVRLSPDSTEWAELAAAACGLLAGAGLPARERRAAGALRDATRAGHTVVLLDEAADPVADALADTGVTVLSLPQFLAHRLPDRWRITGRPAEVVDSTTPDERWYQPLLQALPAGARPPATLPGAHGGTSGPDIQHPHTVASLRRQVARKDGWIDGRTLLTADPRSLARHATAHFYLDGLNDA